MKTFKLISLTTLEKLGDELQNKEIEFYEGLIIDREIDRDRWLVEGYMPKSYEDFSEVSWTRIVKLFFKSESRRLKTRKRH